jgi:hypothetical protein
MKLYPATLWNFARQFWQFVMIEDRRLIDRGIVVQGGANVQMQAAAELYVNLFEKHCA